MNITGTTLFQTPKPPTSTERKQYEQQLKERVRDIAKSSVQLGKALLTLKPNLLQSLVGAAFADVVGNAPSQQTIERLNSAIEELKPGKKVLVVGLWDLNALVSGLIPLVQRLNAVQERFAFFNVIAAVPAGLISDKARVAAWFKEQGPHMRLTPAELATVEDRTIAADFYPQGNKVRKEMGLNYLVGITSSAIVDEDDYEISWDLFSTEGGRILLVSSNGLRDYAAQAGKPFEAAVAFVAIAELLAVLSPKVEYHEDRGCIFDYNLNRDSIVLGLRNPTIEPACLKLIPPRLQEAALALVEVLRQEQVAGKSTEDSQKRASTRAQRAKSAGQTPRATSTATR